MKFRIRSFVIIISLITVACLPSALSAETISGQVSVNGNEPFTFVVITDDQNVQYKVTGSYEKKIRMLYQGKKIKVKGNIKCPPKGEFGMCEIEVKKIK